MPCSTSLPPRVPLVALLALAPLAGCGRAGSSTQADTIQSDPQDAGLDVNGDVDIADVWPTTDPTMGQAPEGGPSFSPDAGDAGPVAPVACTGKMGAAGDPTVSVPFAGLIRTALVHVPASYVPTQPVMLVMNFHGFTSDGLQEAVLSRMNASSDAHGYIAVYPYGVASSFNAGKCCGTAWVDGVDDVGFVKALLQSIAGDYCVDPARVYATGLSNGGFLSHRLGCEMADTFAAIAPVAGVLALAACNPTRPMPVMHFHGTADTLVPYDGNPAQNFPDVASTFAAWAKRDGCVGQPTETFRKLDAHCATYATCAAGATVTLCTIDGGGHTWPGGTPIPSLGYTTPNLSATDAMWDFFKKNPMP